MGRLEHFVVKKTVFAGVSHALNPVRPELVEGLNGTTCLIEIRLLPFDASTRLAQAELRANGTVVRFA
jgi:hypothetical protein